MIMKVKDEGLVYGAIHDDVNPMDMLDKIFRKRRKVWFKILMPFYHELSCYDICVRFFVCFFIRDTTRFFYPQVCRYSNLSIPSSF